MRITNQRFSPLSAEQSAAFAALVEGMWDTERRAQLSNLLQALWRDFQSTPEYEELRQRIIDARRDGRGR